MKIQSLYYYPVKSLKGIDATSIKVTTRGLFNDRRFMLIDKNHQFITARTHPLLARINVEIAKNQLNFRFHGSKNVFTQTTGSLMENVKVKIWDDQSPAHVLAESEFTHELSDRLKEPVQMVYMAETDHRPVSPKYGKPSDLVSFADGYPILITTTGSLNHLNAQLDIPIPMIRFRPNVVIENNQAWVEDQWKKIKVGDVILRVVKPCARCVVTTLNPETGLWGKEPLKTLSRIHRSGNKVLFGMNAIADGLGTISVNQAVEVIE